MAKLIIGTGSVPNDGTGDDLKTAFDKVNLNFTDVYPVLGTFTPVLTGISAAGAGTYNANGQIGRYTKIYNQVFFYIYLSWSAHTGTGGMRITGLPIASLSSTNVEYHAPVMLDLITFSSGTAPSVIARINGNASTIDILRQTSAAALGNVDIDTAGSMTINGHYEIAI